MEFNFVSKALQFICAISAFALMGLFNPTQAFVISSTPSPTAGPITTQIGKDLDLDLKSFRFLSDPKWREQQLASKETAHDGSSPTKSSTDTTTSSGSKPDDSNSNTNPFLRSKRDATDGSTNCTLPTDLPERLEELNLFLNNSGADYIGIIPKHDSFIPIPTNQPTDCPNNPTSTWNWPGTEINLRSTCPYIIEELTQGPNAYPSHLLQAKCLCTDNCVGSTVNKCHEERRPVTIFRMTGCQNGLAVIKKEVVSVTVACFCAAPAPNTGSSNNNDDSSDDMPHAS